MARPNKELLSIRLPSDMSKDLREEAKRRHMTLTEVVEEKVAIATTRDCTLSLDFDGVTVPIKLASKDDFVGLRRSMAK
jgi:hypothetical protein